MKVTETPISSSQTGVNSTTAYVCLVNLLDYYDFITAGTGTLQRHIFESNVRDYQGKVAVNDQIKATLEGNPEEDFWWLNNGITVLARRASLTGKVFNLEDPEIVNGLQTSNEIYNRFSVDRPKQEMRNLLVRLIVTDASKTRDRIIKATNSQTSIPPASLRATDEIHRNIEDHFKAKGLFYDRRKNYYKNQGRPIASIVSISSLAQSLMALILARPDSARARPASLLGQDDVYGKLFDSSIHLDTYLNSALLLKNIEEALKGPGATTAEKGEIKFHALYILGHRICGGAPNRTNLASISIDANTKTMADVAVADSLQFFRSNASSGLSTKNPGFLAALKSALGV